jgi:2-phosphosulfolactate phosphatase
VRISGFDFGNSPGEYDREAVAGKTVIFTTTNGTRALIRAKEARRVLIGALSNLGAVVEWLADETGPVHLVCAGTAGRITVEDVLCAGAIAHWSNLAVDDADAGDDATQLALSLFASCGHDYDRAYQDRVLAILRQSRGGRNLIDCGLEADIAVCAEQGKFDIVPELSREPWEIRVARSRE